ncbi:MAG TPA: hypothetical protein VFE46_02215 [Pirellulales bacterium]|jgi:hypothetical protein|nr:hypothetical protein [Pirellulales bacterium]
MMKRRRFLFWVSFGMFTLAEKLRFSGLDKLAAATIGMAAPSQEEADGEVICAPNAYPEHWTSAENQTWRWYERENYTDGHWKLTGITTPINKETGEPYTARSGYLPETDVPVEMRLSSKQPVFAEDATDTSVQAKVHEPDAARITRHGRPPSKWLRSLNASELRIWLKTIDPPEAGVSGMTYWTHLTRDHFFDADKIAGLTIDEQAKLHAAAHAGY